MDQRLYCSRRQRLSDRPVAAERMQMAAIWSAIVSWLSIRTPRFLTAVENCSTVPWCETSTCKLWSAVCSADGIGAPHSPQVRNALNLRSVSVIERARSAIDNADDEHAASNGVQRQMSVSSVPQLETVCGNKSWLLQMYPHNVLHHTRAKQGRSYVEARGGNLLLGIWPVIPGTVCNTITKMLSLDAFLTAQMRLAAGLCSDLLG